MDIDMDIKELEAFVYVVENCSFSRAAELLHLTQPTISSHVSALERKLNIKLIVRTTKETYPSDAGKLLYKYAKEILQVRENAAIALRNFSQEMKGTISIAASRCRASIICRTFCRTSAPAIRTSPSISRWRTVPRSWSSSPRAV